jgi:competence protein ComEA
MSRFTTLLLTLALAAGFAPLAHAAARDVELTGVVNLNTAGEDELRLLPGIGHAKATRIIEARTKHKFDSTDQLMRVKGFGRKTYRKLKPNLAVTGATTAVRKPKAGGKAAPGDDDVAASKQAAPPAAPRTSASAVPVPKG